MSGDTYAISGLIDKRKTLSGQVEYHREQIKQVKSDLDTIDRAIKVFDPSIDLRTLKPKKMKGQCRFFKHGEATTLLMDLMRVVDTDTAMYCLSSKTSHVSRIASRTRMAASTLSRAI